MNSLILHIEIRIFAYFLSRFFRVVDIFADEDGTVRGIVAGDSYVDCEKMRDEVEKYMKKRDGR